jgi:hypothetical protein
MGKFLYNKRWDNKLKEARQMSSKQMRKFKTKPPFYENHGKLLNQSLFEPQTISLYLHENMLTFFDSVEDIANCWDVYSELDAAKAKLDYEYSHQQYVSEIDELNALIESMAITEHNIHGADYIDSDKPSKKPKMLQMAKPQFYDCIRNSRINKGLIRELSKDKQIYQNSLYSEDMLIRSTKENRCHYLPYIEKMNDFVVRHNLQELCSLNYFCRYKGQDNHRRYIEDGVVKDETLIEDRFN